MTQKLLNYNYFFIDESTDARIFAHVLSKRHREIHTLKKDKSKMIFCFRSVIDKFLKQFFPVT